MKYATLKNIGGFMDNIGDIKPKSIYSSEISKKQKKSHPKTIDLPKTLQTKESKFEYNPENILDTIQHVELNSHSLDKLFLAGRTLMQAESKLKKIGDLTGLNELKTLQIAYENKLANLYDHALESYDHVNKQEIPKFKSMSKTTKANLILRQFQPRSTKIHKANQLINKLLDFQELFNKLANCKDIALSPDGQEKIYEAQLGMMPNLYMNIQNIFETTWKDIDEIQTEHNKSPTQRSTAIGGISNWGNGCYGISVIQALAATKHFATLNSQIDTRNPPATMKEEVQQKVKQMCTQVQTNQPVSANESYRFFQTIFNSKGKNYFNPNARDGGPNHKDSISQHDAASFTDYLLEIYNYQFSIYNHDTIEGKVMDRRAEMDRAIRVPLPRQSEPLTLEQILNTRHPIEVDDDGVQKSGFREEILTSAPPLLPVQLSRFEFSDEAKKIETPVEISLNDPINVKVKEEDRIGQQPYLLTSFVVHIGNTLNGGHYIAYRRQDDGWICCNDSKVIPVSEEQVKAASQQAYTLFFEKQ